MRQIILEEIAAIVPLNELEREHIADALARVGSGACRVEKVELTALWYFLRLEFLTIRIKILMRNITTSH